MARDRRPGRVFVDVGQNMAARTTITPYSPRGRAHPYVATPLTWAEVESGDPEPADVHTMPDRLVRVGDLMAGPG
jgi:bifunctional non-homologous end joining protein LigD